MEIHAAETRNPEEGGLNGNSRKGFEVVFVCEPDEEILSITEFKGEVIVATSKRVFFLKDKHAIDILYQEKKE